MVILRLDQKQILSIQNSMILCGCHETACCLLYISNPLTTIQTHIVVQRLFIRNEQILNVETFRPSFQ